MYDPSIEVINRVKHALLQQAWFTEGRLNAFEFAVKCEADTGIIRTELESEETSMQDVLVNPAYGKNNPMAPGASPRIYRDGYILGLQEAIKLIERVVDDGSTEPSHGQ